MCKADMMTVNDLCRTLAEMTSRGLVGGDTAVRLHGEPLARLRVQRDACESVLELEAVRDPHKICRECAAEAT